MRKGRTGPPLPILGTGVVETGTLSRAEAKAKAKEERAQLRAAKSNL